MNSNRQYLWRSGDIPRADYAVAELRSTRLESAHNVQILSDHRWPLYPWRHLHLLRQEFRDWSHVDHRGRGIRGLLAAQDSVTENAFHSPQPQISNRQCFARLETTLKRLKLKAEHDF
jgi:hypothetical protein